jgi:hypothetical protein
MNYSWSSGLGYSLGKGGGVKFNLKTLQELYFNINPPGLAI